MEFLARFFASDQFMPHGYCLMWRPDIFWLHVGSDALIALAYFSIPAAIVVFALKRRQGRERWVLWMFSAFVLACGLTHVFGIWTMWNPDYGAEGLMKAATALISLPTAAALWPLIPRALRIPSVPELETRVAQRAAELEGANQALRSEIRRRAEVERQLELALHDAQAANRAKTTFLSIMSHELRTPLNAIMGYAQLMQLGGQEANDNHQDYVAQIMRGGQRLLGLIEDILDLSRIESGRMAINSNPISLGDIAAEAVEQALPVAESKSITLEFDPGLETATVIADPSRLSQVLGNLIANAIKYNDAGGKVVVRLAAAADGAAAVRVEDDGWGVPSDRRADLFKPFARLGREMSSAEGTGIGLALTQRIVKLMQGRVYYEPAGVRGSVFVVELPTTTEAPMAAAPPDVGAIETGASEALAVLYIEDNPLNIALMQRIFETVDPTVRLEIAKTGGEGISLATKRRWDLILLDLGLPDVGGLDVLADLQIRLGAAMPRVIVVTADATEATRDAVLSSGVREFVTKPFDVAKIVAMARELASGLADRPLPRGA